MKTVAETLGVARSNLHDKVRQAAKPRASYRKPDVICWQEISSSIQYWHPA
jgi:hypothetical protein